MFSKKSYIVFFVFLILFVITLPIIVLSLYGHLVSGGNYLLSKKSSDWADFGSLLSGVFTLTGAIATLLTLFFLIFQNGRIERERDKQNTREENITKENSIHMIFEKERIVFEKYKLHREMFDDVLNKIESRFNNEFVITNRTILYRNIFTENTFEYCITKIDLGGEEKVNNLVDMCTLANRIHANFKSNYYYSNPDKFILDIIRMSNMIELTHNRKVEHGDIIFNDRIIINVYYPEKIITILTYVLNEIISFTQNSKTIDISYLVDEYKLILAIYSAGITFNLTKERDKIYPLSFVVESNNITKAVNFIKIIDRLPDEVKKSFYGTVRFTQYFFSIKQDVINLSNNFCYLDFINNYILELNADLKRAQERNAPTKVINAINSHIKMVEAETEYF
ncbi:hypothetical protein [Yersinia enterocolitica]|uniref:hypothetical protein n=1 Tax=Yersinia enterocolitica TaxID=630 RepID=UPI001C60FFA4|nr:hypothetical protein [Yersinia enterocolitica]MBW5846021.1 hypothetical protein [Yersinia enterocolitica]MBW5863092.1 hypothetical protein [Yersinia enterocolitica]